MTDNVMAHRTAERAHTENPLESLSDAIGFSSADWAQARDMAWIYGIVLGWDPEPGEPDTGAMQEVADRFGWNPDAVTRLRRLHKRFEQLAKQESTQPEEAGHA